VRKGERDREKEKGGREITIEHEPTIYYNTLALNAALGIHVHISG
jgi:hypothetical protein